MIWQVTYGNGQQRRLTIPAILVSVEEAISATAITTRAVAAAAALLSATLVLASVHFYICRTERLSRDLLV